MADRIQVDLFKISMFHAIDGEMYKSALLACCTCLNRGAVSVSLAFAAGLERLVIKMTGGVTFYTSFEVQPVTTIM